MAGERVAAEQREAVIGRRPDDQDPLAGRVEPSGSVPSFASSTTDCSATRRASARSSSVSSVIRPRTASTSSRSASVKPSGSGLPVGVEQPELELLPQHAPQRGVDHLDVDAPGLDLGGQRFAVGADGRQFDVDTGAQRRGRGLAVGTGDSVQRAQEGDAEVVGDDRARRKPQSRAATPSGARGWRPRGCRRRRRRRSSRCARPTRAPPSQTAAPSRRRTRAGPSTPARGCGQPWRPSSR